MEVSLKLTILVMAFLGLGVSACGGDVVKEAEAKAKAACECKDADCVRPYIKWFNEQSLKDGGAAVKGLSPESLAAYKKSSLEAADCQVKLKTGTP